MKYVMALFMALGFYSFSMAQNDQNDDCLDATSKNQQIESKGQENTDVNAPEDQAKWNEENKSESDMDMNKEEDTSTSADMNSQGEVDRTDKDVQVNETDVNINSEPSSSQAVAPSSTAQVSTTSTEVRKSDESRLENIVAAPFKAAFSVVSETAEGVGHIVGAPFKGVAKLFGDDDNLDE